MNVTLDIGVLHELEEESDDDTLTSDKVLDDIVHHDLSYTLILYSVAEIPVSIYFISQMCILCISL